MVGAEGLVVHFEHRGGASNEAFGASALASEVALEYMPGAKKAAATPRPGATLHGSAGGPA